MSNIDNGGAAFPQSGFERWAPEGGMSLRDYFAAKALAGMLSNYNVQNTAELVARLAYSRADAMLLERSK